MIFTTFCEFKQAVQNLTPDENPLKSVKPVTYGALKQIKEDENIMYFGRIIGTDILIDSINGEYTPKLREAVFFKSIKQSTLFAGFQGYEIVFTRSLYGSIFQTPEPIDDGGGLGGDPDDGGGLGGDPEYDQYNLTFIRRDNGQPIGANTFVTVYTPQNQIYAQFYLNNDSANSFDFVTGDSYILQPDGYQQETWQAGGLYNQNIECSFATEV